MSGIGWEEPGGVGTGMKVSPKGATQTRRPNRKHTSDQNPRRVSSTRSPKARLNVFGNEFETSFGGEDQMDVVLCVARQWCLALSLDCVAPSGAHHHNAV